MKPRAKPKRLLFARSKLLFAGSKLWFGGNKLSFGPSKKYVHKMKQGKKEDLDVENDYKSPIFNS